MSTKSGSWLRLIHVIADVEAELGKVLKARNGLGLTEYRALDILAGAPDSELRMQELAAHMRLNQSSVSRMVERLERSGLTIRDDCPDDKRGVYTVLTDEGRARMENARQHYEEALDSALKERNCEALLSTRFIEAT